MSGIKRLADTLPAAEIARRARAEWLKASGYSSKEIGKILGREFRGGTSARRGPAVRHTQVTGSTRLGRNDPTVSVTGVAELDRKFARMPESLQKKALRPACRLVAKLVRQIALSLVPRRTGALARSLVVRAAKRSRRFKHQVAVSVRTKDGFFHGDEFYGGMIEFGTGPRSTRSGANRGSIREFKFLREGLYSFPDRKRRIFQKAVRDWMRTQTDKERKGAA